MTHKQENLLGVADFRVYTMSIDEKREIDTFQIKKNKLLRFRRAYKRSRHIWASPGSSVGKESACNARDLVSIPGLGRSPGEGNGNPLQYSCLENPMDRGAWQATVHGVARVGHNLVTRPPLGTYGDKSGWRRPGLERSQGQEHEVQRPPIRGLESQV